MRINYIFKDKKLLEEALTHPSMCRDKEIRNYERLEFLGDSVIGMFIAELTYKKFPNLSEGQLSLMQSNLVNTKVLADIAKEIGLGEELIMDYGEKKNNGNNNPRNLENALEALIAAIYIDGGFINTRRIIRELWKEKIKNVKELCVRDAKSLVQEWAQKNGKPLPVYSLINNEGTPHNPTFTIELKVEGENPVLGKGKSKKEAQLQAAQILLSIINK
jgi:ribonuclease III